jgi:8-amino-7-oxononanoate synthase
MQVRSNSHPILVRLEAELEDLRSRRQFRQLAAVPGINLCSNDYLGLGEDPRIKHALADALERGDRCSSSGSRLLSGYAAVWDDLEAELASFSGVEAALYFSSGYLANAGLLSAIIKPEATVFSDRANHASLIDGIRLTGARKVIYPHNNLNYLETALRANKQPGERFIVVESVFSMDGDRAPISDLYALADRYEAALIVDEAHATGVEGPSGRGLVAASGRPDCVLATIHTCGKALASMGAFIACSGRVREYLINKSRTFIFSTALPPYIASQTRTALNIVRNADDRRQHLRRLAHLLRAALIQHGFDTGASESHIIPIILGSNEIAVNTAARLTDAGFGIRAIRPPTVPPGTARLRVSLNSTLTAEHVSSFVQSLKDAQ